MIARYLLAAVASLTLAAAGAAPAVDPPARTAPVVDEHYGDRLVDNYRWMEKVEPGFVSWITAEDARTRSELHDLPGYAGLLADTTRLVEAESFVSDVQRVGSRLYYRKRGPNQAQAALYVRPVAGGSERLLVDPVALAGATGSINDAAPSPDGRFLAYALATGGSEEGTLYIFDVQHGRPLAEAIDRGRFASPTWGPDGSVYFNRLKAGAQGDDRFADQVVYRHHPGADPAHDVPVFSAALVGSALGRAAFVSVAIPPGSKYALGIANSGVSGESELYAAPIAGLVATPKWRCVAALEDKVEAFDVGTDGHTVWLSTFRDAPRRKLLRIDLDAPDLAHAAVAVPERAGVLHASRQHETAYTSCTPKAANSGSTV